MTIDNILLFLSAAIILALIPGQDMLFVIARSLSQGKRAGIIAICGLMLGVSFHTLLTATGLSAIIMASPLTFSVIKYLGAAYLIYLGIRAWLSNESLVLEKNKGQSSDWKVFKEGVLSSLLNPKLALFFISFLPQFVSPESPPFAQILILGGLFMLCALPILITATFLAAGLGKMLTHKPEAQKYTRWASASTLIGLGLYLTTAEKTS